MPAWLRFLSAFSSTLGAALLLPAMLLPDLALAQSPMDDCNKLLARAAMTACTRVIDDQQTNAAGRALAYFLRARAELDITEIAKAEADLDAGLALQPNNAFAYRVRGRLRGLQSRNADARADYNKALQLSTTVSAQHVSHVDRGWFLTRLNELPDALADFDSAVRLDSTKASAYVGRAVVYRRMNKAEDALANLDWAAKVEPAYWLTYVERGDLLLAEKRYAEAVAAFDLALARRSDDARATRGRAAAQAGLGSTDGKAPEPPRVASPAPATPPGPSTSAPSPAPPPSTAAPVPSTPANPQTAAVPSPGDTPAPAGQDPEERRKKLQSALELRQNRKFDDALVIYNTMLRAAPTDPEATVEKGRTLMQMTRWKEALDTLKPVAENKNGPSNWRALALASQGEILAANNQFEGAIPLLGSALQLNPRLEGALFWRGLSLYSTGKFSDALADFRQASSMAPKSAIYPSFEALSLIGSGDSAKAKEAIDRSLATQADNSSALVARARLRLASGDLAAAEADIAQVQQRGALTPVAMQTQQLIMIHKIFKPTDQPGKQQGR